MSFIKCFHACFRSSAFQFDLAGRRVQTDQGGAEIRLAFLPDLGLYRKSRLSEERRCDDGHRELDAQQCREERRRSLRFTGSHYITLFAAIATLVVQLWTKSLPLGALIGLTIIFGTRAIDPEKMDTLINEGIGLMGYVAFVMLVAAGFAGAF